MLSNIAYVASDGNLCPFADVADASSLLFWTWITIILIMLLIDILVKNWVSAKIRALLHQSVERIMRMCYVFGGKGFPIRICLVRNTDASYRCLPFNYKRSEAYFMCYLNIYDASKDMPLHYTAP